MNKSAKNTTFFITGVQRSGTTLLAFLLGNHPEIHMMPYSIAFRLITCFNRYEKQGLKQGKKQRLKKIIEQDYKGRLAAFLDYENLDKYATSQDLIQHSIEAQLAHHKRKVWMDKSPNLQHYIPDLLKWLPESKFIHIIRDGRAVAYSMSRRTGKNILLSAQEWVDGNSIALQQQQLLGEQRFKIIRYEDVVEQAEATLKEICELAQLPFQKEMLNLSKNERTQSDNSYVKNTLDTSKLYRYKEELDKETLQKIERIQAPLLHQFDYPLLHTSVSHRYQPLSKTKRIWLSQQDNLKQLFQRRQTRMEDWQTLEVHIPLRKRIYTFLRNLERDFRNI